MPEIKDTLVMELLKDSLTKKEVLKIAESLIKQILELEKKLVEKQAAHMASMEEKIQGDFDTMKRGEDNDFVALKRDVEKIKDKFFTEITNALKYVREKAEGLKDGEKGADGWVPTEEELAALIEKVLPKSEEITPQAIRDKLEGLSDDDRLSIAAIHDLERRLDELEKRPVGGRGGGGFSYIAFSQHVIDDETPSGSGTAFTIANTPNPTSSFKLYRGGARQRITEDYTLSGRTLTLNVTLQTGEILLCDYRT
mgnify:CR=1 FL=1